MVIARGVVMNAATGDGIPMPRLYNYIDLYWYGAGDGKWATYNAHYGMTITASAPGYISNSITLNEYMDERGYYDRGREIPYEIVLWATISLTSMSDTGTGGKGGDC